jgi:hypothetical protein
MRLFLATLAMSLVVVGTALARPPGPQPTVTSSQTPVASQDLRAPDQIAPAPTPAATIDLRAPDQQAPVQARPSARPSDGGPAPIVFVLIGVGGALVLSAGGYFAVRWRHRLADADDLVVNQ